MSTEFSPRHLDVRAFAQTRAHLSGSSPLSAWPRLTEEADGAGADYPVNWTADGAFQEDASGSPHYWLHLHIQATVPMICQRCLDKAEIAIAVDRSFRFVGSEEQAEKEDEISEEDVLVWERDFDLLALIEDELLMELPLVPRHEVCPASVRLEVKSEDFDAAQAEKPQPFAALASWRSRPDGDAGPADTPATDPESDSAPDGAPGATSGKRASRR